MHANSIRAVTAGVGSALIYAGGMYLMTRNLFPDSGMAVASFLFGAPIASCILVTLISDPRGEAGVGRNLTFSAITLSLLLLASMIFAKEGWICVVIVAPLFYVLGSAASLLTQWILRRLNHRRRTVGMFILIPLLGLPVEGRIEYPYSSAHVTSSIIIDAPAEVVWARTTELRNIAAHERRLDFSHSVARVPYPLDARLDGVGPGAVRHIQWTRGLRFREEVTAWSPGRHLAWRFAFDPDSIPLSVERNIDLNGDYLRLTQGEYRLDPLPGGRTRLTLTTRYWIKTPLNGYLHLWGRIFLNDMHGAVLDVIESRSETAALAPYAPPV